MSLGTNVSLASKCDKVLSLDCSLVEGVEVNQASALDDHTSTHNTLCEDNKVNGNETLNHSNPHGMLDNVCTIVQPKVPTIAPKGDGNELCV